ncbi:hypothetical protein SLE2022_276150 [Rubroshorea leprosula]
MKFHAVELPLPPNGMNSPNRLFFLALTLFLLTLVPLCLWNWGPPLTFPKIDISGLRKSKEQGKKCDIFTGQWVPHPEGPYYTTNTCRLIIDEYNCIKFGRADTEFMKWRWKPEGCELPYFDAVQFLELVRGKSMAFVGDSVGRNQMHSLLCLLAKVATTEDTSHKYSTDTEHFQHWYYADYNFSLVALWSPYLVKTKEADPNGYSNDSLMNLYLDEADEEWAGQIESYNYVIISVGQWFFRPMYYYEKGKLVGCFRCPENNITNLGKYYGYKMAFRTAFRTLLSLKSYKGVTFLRTFSPAHFDAAWNKGGDCVRTTPYTSQDEKLQDFQREFYLTQAGELRAAEEEGRRRGLKFGLLNTTEIMWLRPDGHPSHFGRSHRNVTTNDCVHWCLPGPIDTWNEFLLYLMKREVLTKLGGKLMQNE